MTPALTTDITGAIAAWARCTIGSKHEFPMGFLLLSERHGGFTTQGLLAHDRAGGLRLVPHEGYPIAGLLADLRGCLASHPEESDVIILAGSCTGRGCALLAYPEDAARWTLEPWGLGPLKSLLRAPMAARGWRLNQRLDV